MNLYALSARDVLAIATGFLVSLAGLHVALGKPINPEEALLNPGTVVVFESDGGSRIHCRDVRDFALCLDGHWRRGGPLALWLGNSQLHAINQYQRGQMGAPLLLHRALRRNGVDLLTFSYGNANLQEHAVQYVYLNSLQPIATLIVALVYDDTREDGVRADVQPFLRSDSVRRVLRKYEIGRTWLEEIDRPKQQNDVGESVQARVERWLDRSLSAFSAVWRQRSEIAYQYFVTLHRVRNEIFRIKPQSVRRRLPAVYAKNLASLQLMLAEAAAHRTRVVLYIAPLRQDIPIPYVRSEYDNFKRTMREYADRYTATFVDLDSIVPPTDWGEKNATGISTALELDFMHFTSDGHAALADRLLGILRNGHANHDALQ